MTLRAWSTGTCVLASLVVAGCGGQNALKNAADDVVRGTNFKVTSVDEVGEGVGVVKAEASDGSEIEFKVKDVYDTFDYAQDTCDVIEDNDFNCSDLVP